MLQPKRTKYRKQFKAQPGPGNARQQRVLRRVWPEGDQPRAHDRARDRGGAPRHGALRERGGQIWIRVFPDVPITKKPLEVRMGSGKGNVEYYVARVQPGKVCSRWRAWTR